MSGGGPTSEAVKTEIAVEILRVHQESYGTGASDIQVHLLKDMVMIVIDVELSPAEVTLLEAGHPDAVKLTRESFQAAIGATFTAIVERATGRRVASFLSTINLDPPYAVEIFRLAPAATRE